MCAHRVSRRDRRALDDRLDDVRHGCPHANQGDLQAGHRHDHLVGCLVGCLVGRQGDRLGAHRLDPRHAQCLDQYSHVRHRETPGAIRALRCDWSGGRRRVGAVAAHLGAPCRDDPRSDLSIDPVAPTTRPHHALNAPAGRVGNHRDASLAGRQHGERLNVAHPERCWTAGRSCGQDRSPQTAIRRSDHCAHRDVESGAAPPRDGEHPRCVRRRSAAIHPMRNAIPPTLDASPPMTNAIHLMLDDPIAAPQRSAGYPDARDRRNAGHHQIATHRQMGATDVPMTALNSGAQPWSFLSSCV